MKAFDMVPHKRLIFKLKLYNFQEGTIKWIQAFLTDHVQQVVINGEPPSWMNGISGMPHGSVLGPILFIICINDVLEFVKSRSYFFADNAPQ